MTLPVAENIFARLNFRASCKLRRAPTLKHELSAITLKRRRQLFRAVPIPSHLMDLLGRLTKVDAPDTPVWSWCRQTAWRRVKRVMDTAGISGAHAMPKGLRHGFGVANAEENVPMATTQKWLGHAKLETTAIYQQVVGREENAFARRLWRNWR